jgi:DNA replication protein DnaC
MLVRLQLSDIRDQLESLLDEAARANLSARGTLILMCEREIARKDHRRIEMGLKLAHLPTVRELAGFAFEAQPPRGQFFMTQRVQFRMSFDRD